MSPSLKLQLPDDLKSFYEESGYLPSTMFENRTNARLRVRRDALLEFIFTPSVLLQNPSLHDRREGRVLIKDLSRTGIGVLYHEQVFPKEQFQLTFQNRRIYVTAVRCRRLNEACYEIGGRVLTLQTLDDQFTTEST